MSENGIVKGFNQERRKGRLRFQDLTFLPVFFSLAVGTITPHFPVAAVHLERFRLGILVDPWFLHHLAIGDYTYARTMHSPNKCLLLVIRHRSGVEGQNSFTSRKNVY